MAEALGTPSYMAPEQAAGDAAQLTSATDVYGLGAVFYHLLTQRALFVGGTIYKTVQLVLETEPQPPRLLNPKVDRDLSTICLKCLEKDPQHRYSSALELAEDLERWLTHKPIQARRAGIAHPRKKMGAPPSNYCGSSRLAHRSLRDQSDSSLEKRTNPPSSSNWNRGVAI